jgi:hypothetical protein
LREKRNAYRILVRKEATRKTMIRWMDNIKIDLGDRGWDGMV